MGWTHDYRDVTDVTQERGDADAAVAVTDTPGRGDHRPGAEPDPRIGIPRIIHRRARWVSARLRHPRSR
ncbi:MULTISPECIES: hypothetical protein [Streptomyces]|uniref:Uncharacterized protein n=2 Tax=Streptomyces TaxID=1883 RepID=A0A939FMB7_9ACTN|nr:MULTISPECIES: hypothetical protein [Streptomyces]MBO0652567.1 hypothetical protein [Streptomyces triculaminicus]QSY51837.1 hypothetical protein J3S04_13895 [Streptomyces griseocarneus]